ncbi:hypothetical protein AK812_SmicGene6156 [Symbiodinium microadriaticum]|uniref:Uncharacterized protein n=1 Tax=Symbiodinium microadriaticum TaxID=2951 RepID=A0A1Q9ERW2_SYMMI|nr:hypothetical protein AK812_SmicGene6156 [Symbiodinium microadriaticum]CAE7400868.1 unnamed protein product [Symbiodinium microadriaticum]
MQRLLLVVAASAALASDVTPVQKVIQMLEDMKDKGKKEMEAEQVQFGKFDQFCEMTLADKGRSISDAADKIETLEADIQQAISETERLTNEIAAHTSDIESTTTEKTEATELREKERGEFQTTLQDYTESVDAIGRALKALKEEDKKTSFVQLTAAKSLKLMPSEAVDSIDAYLNANKPKPVSEKPSLIMEATESEKPEPKTYEFQSGAAIQMLETLADKFVDERNKLEQEEQAKRHAYELLAQQLTVQISESKKEKSSKEQFKAKKVQSKASSEGDLAETKAEKEADEKFAKDLKATCAKKAAAFSERQKTRQEEIEAVGKAQEIISSGSVAGKAEKHLPGLLQRSPRGSVLAFLRSDSHGDRKDQVARFLQQRASALNSRMLSALAVRVGADPLGKVKKMIQQLLTKLNEQAKEEATKNTWCVTELATNKATREEKTDTSESLQSEIDTLKASIAKLTDESNTLSKDIAELDAGMASATDLREKEAAKNKIAVADAKEAQAAVAEALTVLKEFYAKATGATSFVQSSSASLVTHGQPEIFGDEAYTGMGGESGGVLGMMEVIESDFARLEAETTAAEEAGKKEYDEFMDDSKADKATKETTLKQKTTKKNSDAQELSTRESDLEGTQKELEAANAYLEKLRPDCIDTGKSYAERKAQREQEITDLKEAVEMLENL